MVGRDSVGRGEGGTRSVLVGGVGSRGIVPGLSPFRKLSLASSERVQGRSSFASGVVLDMGVPSLHPSAAFLAQFECDEEDCKGLCEWLVRLWVAPDGLFCCERVPLASVGYLDCGKKSPSVLSKLGLTARVELSMIRGIFLMDSF